ncbi:hypothetical protein DFH11DRAFT_1730976 [Phellopilus nigrolimitatus]|nr:hypothetical protein DFH11DRAFT_1730976 [Phellopilus nigrolimitatus]
MLEHAAALHTTGQRPIKHVTRLTTTTSIWRVSEVAKVHERTAEIRHEEAVAGRRPPVSPNNPWQLLAVSPLSSEFDMLIDLPALPDYDMTHITCEDLFMPSIGDEFEIDVRGGMGKSGGMAGRFTHSGAMSELDMSDAEAAECNPLLKQSKVRSRAVASPYESQAEREISLHSPGTLLGTPRDSSRRYEYPFPNEANEALSDSGLASGLSLSTTSTPALTPPLAGAPSPSPPLSSVSSLETSPSSSLIGVDVRPGGAPSSMSIPIPAPTPAPAPAPVPKPISSAKSSSSASSTAAPLAPLAVAQPVPGPMSAPANTSTAGHPKLLRFNSADTPVPPGLRGRARKSASTSAAQTFQATTPTAGS